MKDEIKWEEVKKYSHGCEKHRHVLARCWNETAPAAICIGLNPSTADIQKEDPTTRKIIKILDYNGYGSFAIVNLFHNISPDPSLINEEDFDDVYLRGLNAYFPDSDIIYMWGAKEELYAWRTEMIKDICYTRGGDILCFGKTKKGYPKHPLYLSNKTKLEKYESNQDVQASDLDERDSKEDDKGVQKESKK